MSRRNTILAGIVVSIFMLHLDNALFQAFILPNYARSYMEGVTVSPLNLERLLNRESDFPPVYEFNASLISRFVGKKFSLIYLINNTPYFVFLILFLFLLGRSVKDAQTGILAALTVSLYPLICAAYNRYCMEFALLPVIVAFLYFLHKSDYLIDIKYSALVGITIAYGSFLKEVFPAFIAGPILYVLFLAIKDVFKGNSKRIITLLIVTLFCLGGAIGYFGFGKFKEFFWGKLFTEPSGLSWYDPGNLRLFWAGLWESQLSLPFFLLLIPGAYYFLKEKDRHLKISVVLLILVPNLFVMFMPHWKNERYLLPQLPVMAFVSAFGLRRVMEIKFGKAVLAVVVVLGLVQIFDFTYNKIGLSYLSWGKYPYWKPEDLSLSVPIKLRNTDLSDGISIALVKNIQLSEKIGVKKKQIKVAFIPEDWTLESFLVKSYFQFNSDIKFEHVEKESIVYNYTKGDKTSFDIDYIVQMVPKNKKRESIYSSGSNVLKYSFDKSRVINDNEKKVLDWSALQNRWFDYMKNFKDLGRVCGNNKYDVYIYSNSGNLGIDPKTRS